MLAELVLPKLCSRLAAHPDDSIDFLLGLVAMALKPRALQVISEWDRQLLGQPASSGNEFA